MALPAQIQSVRGPGVEPPSFMENFLNLLGSGFSGYLDRQEARKQLPIDIFKSVAPSLASIGSLRPVRSGEQGILPNIPWAYQNKPMDYGEQFNKLKTTELGWELGDTSFGTPTDTYRWSNAHTQAAKDPAVQFAGQMAAMKPNDTTALQNYFNLENQVATEIYNRMGGKTNISEPKRIRVRMKKTKQTGTIDESEFDPKIYERL